MISQRDALYRAICQFPDEDTPRLIFADLIEEEGESARAAFIRTQVELAALPDYDPLWVKCRQFDPGVTLGQHMTHTLPKLPDGFTVRAFRFRRGFVWRVTALNTEALARRGDDLFDVAPIRALCLDDRPDLAELADCPALARLHRLEFADTFLDGDDIAALVNSPHAAGLTDLVFESDAIRAEGLELLAGSELFGRLQALRIDKHTIAPALLVDALAAADEPGNLHKLSLPFNELQAPDAATLFGLPALRTLDHLDLRDNKQFRTEGAEALAESGLLRGLRILNLEQTFPGTQGVRALAATGALAGVRSLDLTANRLGPVAAKLLAESRSVRGLRVLKLGNNPIGHAGAEALAGSRHLAGLLELDLRDCGIGDAGAMALAESPHLDGLLRLDLRSVNHRPLGDEARAALRERFDRCVSFESG